MPVYTKPALAVAGTILYHELRTFLRAQHYAPVNIDEAIAFIEANGTMTGCGSIEAADRAECNLIAMNRVGHLESDPSEWPALFDEEVWALSEPTPAAGDQFLIPEDLVPAFEPTAADLEWAAALFAAGASLSSLPPVCGGAPSPADLKPVRVRGRRNNNNITDADMAIHGAVG